jgi:hypothetical protein
MTTPHVTHIEIVKYYRFFEVRVIGPSGRPVQTPDHLRSAHIGGGTGPLPTIIAG